MPKSGREYEMIRKGKLNKLNFCQNYSQSLITLVNEMMSRNPQDRPTAQGILDRQPADDAIRLEIQHYKLENKKLKEKFILL